MINLRFASLFLRNTQFRRFQRFLRSLPAQREDSLFLTDSCVQVKFLKYENLQTSKLFLDISPLFDLKLVSLFIFESLISIKFSF